MRECARHHKRRSQHLLRKTAEGLWVCCPGEECKSGVRSQSMEKGICSLHGKSRSASKLKVAADGKLVCIPGGECLGYSKDTSCSASSPVNKEQQLHPPRSESRGYELRLKEFPALKSQSKIKPIFLKKPLPRPPPPPPPKPPSSSKTKSVDTAMPGAIQKSFPYTKAKSPPKLPNLPKATHNPYLEERESVLSENNRSTQPCTSQNQRTSILQEPTAEYSHWDFKATSNSVLQPYHSTDPFSGVVKKREMQLQVNDENHPGLVNQSNKNPQTMSTNIQQHQTTHSEFFKKSGQYRQSSEFFKPGASIKPKLYLPGKGHHYSSETCNPQISAQIDTPLGFPDSDIIHPQLDSAHVEPSRLIDPAPVCHPLSSRNERYRSVSQGMKVGFIDQSDSAINQNSRPERFPKLGFSPAKMHIYPSLEPKLSAFSREKLSGRHRAHTSYGGVEDSLKLGKRTLLFPSDVSCQTNSNLQITGRDTEKDTYKTSFKDSSSNVGRAPPGLSKCTPVRRPPMVNRSSGHDLALSSFPSANHREKPDPIQRPYSLIRFNHKRNKVLSPIATKELQNVEEPPGPFSYKKSVNDNQHLKCNFSQQLASITPPAESHSRLLHHDSERTESTYAGLRKSFSECSKRELQTSYRDRDSEQLVSISKNTIVREPISFCDSHDIFPGGGESRSTHNSVTSYETEPPDWYIESQIKDNRFNANKSSAAYSNFQVRQGRSTELYSISKERKPIVIQSSIDELSNYNSCLEQIGKNNPILSDGMYSDSPDNHPFSGLANTTDFNRQYHNQLEFLNNSISGNGRKGNFTNPCSNSGDSYYSVQNHQQQKRHKQSITDLDQHLPNAFPYPSEQRLFSGGGNDRELEKTKVGYRKPTRPNQRHLPRDQPKDHYSRAQEHELQPVGYKRPVEQHQGYSSPWTQQQQKLQFKVGEENLEPQTAQATEALVDNLSYSCGDYNRQRAGTREHFFERPKQATRNGSKPQIQSLANAVECAQSFCLDRIPQKSTISDRSKILNDCFSSTKVVASGMESSWKPAPDVFCHKMVKERDAQQHTQILSETTGSQQSSLSSQGGVSALMQNIGRSSAGENFLKYPNEISKKCVLSASTTTPKIPKLKSAISDRAAKDNVYVRLRDSSARCFKSATSGGLLPKQIPPPPPPPTRKMPWQANVNHTFTSRVKGYPAKEPVKDIFRNPLLNEDNFGIALFDTNVYTEIDNPLMFELDCEWCSAGCHNPSECIFRPIGADSDYCQEFSKALMEALDEAVKKGKECISSDEEATDRPSSSKPQLYDQMCAEFPALKPTSMSIIKAEPVKSKSGKVRSKKKVNRGTKARLSSLSGRSSELKVTSRQYSKSEMLKGVDNSKGKADTIKRRMKIKSGKVSKRRTEKRSRAKVTVSPLSPQCEHIDDNKNRSLSSSSGRTFRRLESEGSSPPTKSFKEGSKLLKRKLGKKSGKKRMVLEVAEIVRDDASDLEILHQLRKQLKPSEIQRQEFDDLNLEIMGT